MGNGCLIAPVSTLIGVVVFVCCIYSFGAWGLLSLIFVIPFIKGFIMRAREDEMRKKQTTHDD